MEHYKQQMKDKIKEGVAAFSERGSEGNKILNFMVIINFISASLSDVKICKLNNRSYRIVIDQLGYLLIFGPRPLLEIVFSQFRPCRLVKVLQLEHQPLVYAVPKVLEEFLHEFGHTVHLSVVLAVEFRVTRVRTIFIVVIIALFNNKSYKIFNSFVHFSKHNKKNYFLNITF